MSDDVLDAAARLAEEHPDVRWSVCIRDAPTGDVVAALREHWIHPIASIGKVLLLVCAADQLEDGRLSPGDTVSRNAIDAVHDSGLWQHLRVDALPLADIAALVGAVSDNVGTNVLLDLVGLDAVDDITDRLGMTATALHDAIRDERRSPHPPSVATGTAAELSALFGHLHAGTAISPAVSARVRRWLSLNCDLSLVPAALGIDPLAHSEPSTTVAVFNKTGTDHGVLADAGVLTGPRASLSYAVLAEYDEETTARRDVVAAMSRYGITIGDLISTSAPTRRAGGP